tara:strand:- start:53 stop:484 length:432 start_codon:yes stop_codon:yes gene_type:complete
MQGLVDLFAPLYDLWQSFEAFMAGPGSPGLFGYWIVICLMMSGFYVVIAHDNLIKKLIGLNVFQVSVFLFYILMAKVTGGTAPILAEGITQFSNPLPHVLILTAIVVGVATTALGLALVVRIREAYDTIEDDEIQAVEEEEDR